MSANYAEQVSRKEMPQTEQARPDQVPNSAGGFGFPVSDWVRLDRFLILGNEGGSYYATEKALTRENAACVERCLKEDGRRVVSRVVEISASGRAPKNDPALFALALAASVPDTYPGAHATRGAAFDALGAVCRIPTHLFTFVENCSHLRGWGRAMRRGIAAWYEARAAGDLRGLAYHMVKYQQRNGMSHADLLRQCHVKSDRRRTVVGTKTKKVTGAGGSVTYREVPLYESGRAESGRDLLFDWALRGNDSDFVRFVTDVTLAGGALDPVFGFRALTAATTAEEVCRLVTNYDMPRECVPTKWLTEPSVWWALLQRMPLGALVRNLATMTRVGLLAPMSDAVRTVHAKLTDAEYVRKSRLHPVKVLAAMLTYGGGRGAKATQFRKGEAETWLPDRQVMDGLDRAFYLSFKNVEPTGKRFLLALDVSASMGSPELCGVPGLTPRVGAAAMAMVTAATEANYHVVAFTSGGYKHPSVKGAYASYYGVGTGVTPLDISPRQRLDDVLKATTGLPFGGTDVALPFLYATEKNLAVDCFVTLTDNETWAGGIHPFQALQAYRRKTGINAKMVYVGMTATGVSCGDPSDAGTLDVCGFDTNVPAIIEDFARG